MRPLQNTEKANDKFAQFYSNFEIITEASDTEVRLFISHCSVCSQLDLSGLHPPIKLLEMEFFPERITDLVYITRRILLFWL